MKILITGGAGFIGSHLADCLLRKGEEVFVVDNLSTGSLENIEHLQWNPQLHFELDTIFHKKVVDRLISRCDQIYHLAAAVGVKLIMERPVESLETNVKGTEIVLKLAHKYSKKVLIASTSEVYGKAGSSIQSLTEGTDRLMGSTTKRRWAYACSKAFDEFLALAYYEEKGLPIVIVRLFNTAGPRQTDQYGMVVPNFVQRALADEPIIVHGDGSQTRSFTYVEDVVNALVKLMAESKAEGQIFNIGSEKEVSIKELALLVKEIVGSESEIEYVPYKQIYGLGFEDMDRRCPDITKIREVIDFQPSTSLREIIQSVIDYYKR